MMVKRLQVENLQPFVINKMLMLVLFSALAMKNIEVNFLFLPRLSLYLQIFQNGV